MRDDQLCRDCPRFFRLIIKLHPSILIIQGIPCLLAPRVFDDPIITGIKMLSVPRVGESVVGWDHIDQNLATPPALDRFKGAVVIGERSADPFCYGASIIITHLLVVSYVGLNVNVIKGNIISALGVLDLFHRLIGGIDGLHSFFHAFVPIQSGADQNFVGIQRRVDQIPGLLDVIGIDVSRDGGHSIQEVLDLSRDLFLNSGLHFSRDLACNSLLSRRLNSGIIIPNDGLVNSRLIILEHGPIHLALGLIGLGPISLWLVSLGPISLWLVNLRPISIWLVSLGPISLWLVNLGPIRPWLVSLGSISLSPFSFRSINLRPISLWLANFSPIGLGPISLGFGFLGLVNLNLDLVSLNNSLLSGDSVVERFAFHGKCIEGQHAHTHGQ